MFKITHKRGFHITFPNEYTVSVQFGPGNYCENYNMDISEIGSEEAGKKGSVNAECAVWGPNGEMIEHESFDGDTVGGRMSATEVLGLLNWAESQK